jgi:hypothetical protein
MTLASNMEKRSTSPRSQERSNGTVRYLKSETVTTSPGTRMETSRLDFGDSIHERVASPVVMLPDLVLKVARPRREQHRLEDCTLTRSRPNEPHPSYRTLFHIHLSVPTEVGLDGGTRSRCRHRSITVIRGIIHPLPPLPPSSPYPRVRVHLPSWSLLIAARPLLHIRQFQTHLHPHHPLSRHRRLDSSIASLIIAQAPVCSLVEKINRYTLLLVSPS